VGESFGGKLRLFIDTADSESWQRSLPSGAFYGVTTNPILLEKANVPCRVETLSQLANTAFDLGATEVQIQTWGQTVDEMVTTGLRLAEISPGAIVVKIPVTKIGLQAASTLTKSGARVTMTGVYSVHQALLAVGVGAAYAAPYLGRMVALGKPGMNNIQEMQQIVTGVQSDMRLLVASIKDVEQITTLAASGVNSFAIPLPIIEKLLQDDDTDKAAADFEEAVSRTLVNAA
jgi:transaldolase